MPADLESLNKLIKEENLITGKEAIQLSGMPDHLIEIISMQNLYFGSITTFKVNDLKNLPPFNSPGAAKPSNIHSKTSNLVGGYIPVDPIFTRLDANRNPLGHHYKDKLELQESVQVKWTLWELLNRCDSTGDLYMDWPHEISPIVRFRFKENKGPKGFEGCFQLNLGEEKKIEFFNITDIRVVTRSFDDPEKFFHLIPLRIKEAFFNNHKEIIYIPYKIFYNKEKNSAMQPLKVFSIDGKPIISDWDKELESLPLKVGILNLESANKEFNTFTSDMETNHFIEQVQLIKATKKLFLNFLYKNFMFNEDFNNKFLLGLNKNSKNLIKDIDQLFYEIAIKTCLLERAGVITPYEFLMNILTNHVHNCDNSKQGLTEYFNDPCQHGVEGRSPFNSDKNIISNSDSPRFHVVVAEDTQLNYSIHYIYTINETQRINLYLTNGILESNFIHISHWLDMRKWEQIIAKQIELRQKQLIDDRTFDKYLLYLSSKKVSNMSRNLANHDRSIFKRRASTHIMQIVSTEEMLFNFNRRRSSSVEDAYNINYNGFINVNHNFPKEISILDKEKYTQIKQDHTELDSDLNSDVQQELCDLNLSPKILRTNSNLAKILNNVS